MHRATGSSQWFHSIWTSQKLEQYDTLWDSQHFREDDWPAKTATASYLQGSPNAEMHQGLTEKVTGLRRDSFSREVSQLSANAGRNLSVPRDSSVHEADIARTKAAAGGCSPGALSGPVPGGVSDMPGNLNFA